MPCFRRLIVAQLFLAVVVGVPRQGRGHLCMVRQGTESAGVIEAGDRYGAAVAAGDFNGDGYVDLAVGAPFEDVGAIADAGAVVISYGGPTGITHAGAHILTQDNLGYTSEPTDNFGFSLTVGNFNNDAYADLAIGSPGESINGIGDAGNVIIVLGSASGLTGAAMLVSQANSPGNVELNDRFGWTLAAGDFNGDHFDDLAVGIPYEDLETGPTPLLDAGAVEIYFGSATGITTTGAYIITDDDTINAAAQFAKFGNALAAGRFDSDARDDLAVGLPGKNTSGFSQHGVVEVLYGSTTGITATGAQLFSQVSFGGVNEAGDEFGYALAAGNCNGDSYDDLAVGTPFKGANDGGRVYVAYGSPTGITTTGSIGFGQSVSATNDYFGIALDFGDYNDDGYDELAVGVPGKNLGAGVAWIYSGSAGGLLTGLPTQRTPANLSETSESGDGLGSALAFGAFAGGSREGLAIGAPGEDWDPVPGDTNPSVPDAGAVYIDLPWKQVQNLTADTCMLTDCTNRIVFSKKPFEPHLLASTSKMMTLLLACEAVQPGCSPCASLADVYTVPTVLCNKNLYTGGSIGGSLANLCPGEQITLGVLLYAMMYPSGNDAAFSIADHIADPNVACSTTGCADIMTFVAMMNARAQQLGMTATNYENPSGADHASWPSQNVASADNMAKLAYYAMQNSLFRTVVGGTSFGTVRSGPPTCLPGNATPPASNWSTGVYIMPGGQGPDFPNASGVKPGFTPAAGNTLVCAVDHPQGRYFGVVLGEPSGANLITDMTALLTLASTVFCGDAITLPPPPPGTVRNLPANPATTGSTVTWNIPIVEPPDRGFNVRATLTAGSPSASATLRMHRTVQARLDPGELAVFTISPFRAHGGIHIENTGPNRASLTITATHPTTNTTVILSHGDQYAIPSDVAVVPTNATVTVLNNSASDAAELEVVELDVHHSLTLAPGGPAFQVRLTASPPFSSSYIDLALIGQSTVPGAAIDLLVANTLDTDPGCDGSLGPEDTPAFVLALLDPALYAVQFEGCYIGAADRNGDGYIDGGDIPVFIGEILGP